MRRSKRGLMIALAALQGSGAILMAPAAKAEEAPACAAMDTALPGSLSAWTDRGTPAGERLAVGKAATLALRPMAEAGLTVKPGRVPEAGTYGGAIPVSIEKAGNYQIALGARAWVDIVKNGKAVTSVAHGHGPACSSIRKIVTFPLKAGLQRIEISGATDESIALLLIPAP